MPRNLLFLLIILALLGLILLFVSMGSSQPEPSPDEIAFAQLLGYEIKNPSTITYVGLGQMGRMGNQLFEIAATVATAKQNQCRVVFPDIIKKLPIYQIFDLKLPLRQDVRPDQNLPEMSNFDHLVIPSDGRVYGLEGYRQSIKYLEPIRKQLQILFPVKKKEKTRDQIAIHIRRTDCIKTNPVQRFFDPPLNCSLDYYRASIKRLKKLHRLPRRYPIVVVTDDRKWCQDHLSEIDPEAELSSEGTLADDFLTLVSSRYLVISNSTFSLWGGLLSRADQIIAPSFWWHPDNKIVYLIGSDRQHLCPSDWLFQNPITGDMVERSYDWPDQIPGRGTKFIRSVLLSNRFRKWM